MRPLPFPVPTRSRRAPALAGLLVFAALAPLPRRVDAQLPILADGFESGTLCAWGVPSHLESFDGLDGDPWPAPWQASGDGVDLALLAGGRARLRPVNSDDPYSLGRMVADVPTADVEVAFTVVFEDAGTQGVGFYVRQNGGFLRRSTPHGAGYAVFVQNAFGNVIGVWREVDGIEEVLPPGQLDVGFAFANGTPYRVRFRVTTADPTHSRLQAKVWPEAEVEPAAWTVEALDDTPPLQGIVGGIAVDSYSSFLLAPPVTAATLVDDVRVVPLCPP